MFHTGGLKFAFCHLSFELFIISFVSFLGLKLVASGSSGFHRLFKSAMLVLFGVSGIIQSQICSPALFY